MLRRQFLWAPAGLALGQAAARPEVLLIVAHGWRGLEWQKVVETPALARLEREGVRFGRAYAACPSTDAARGAIVSGSYPHAKSAPVLQEMLGTRLRVEEIAEGAAEGDYYRRVRAMDRRLGELLETAGEQTLVVFTANHGDMLGAHELEGADAPYEESARVPLVVRFPGTLMPTSTDVLVSHVDLAATILGLCGMDVPASMQGRNLAPFLLKGTGERPESVYCQGKLGRPGEWRMVVRAVDKLITDREGEPTHLFNLAQDPLEMENLVDVRAHLRTKDELNALLQIWRKKTKDGRSASGLRQRR